MRQSTADTCIFHLGHHAYRRNMVRGWLFFGGFLLTAILSLFLSLWFFPSYSHSFTPYLKWQDALLALFWYITLVSLGGCILVLRFLYALRIGYRQEMLQVIGDSTLIVRDLSHENLSSIFWLTGTALSCFVAALIGLIPEMLLEWTLQLSSPVLAFFATVLVVLLGVGGLAITLPAGSFVLIGWVGSISFCRNMGASHTYHLTSQTNLTIDNFVLTILYPDAPESMIDLKLLDSEDRHHLLCLLREHWLSIQNQTQHPWNPLLGEEIQAALDEAGSITAPFTAQPSGFQG